MRNGRSVTALFGTGLMGIALLAVAGCQNSPPGTAPLPGDHVIGYRDTPEATKVPPADVPRGTPVGEDGTTSYAQPSNPVPPGGMTVPPPPPASQPVH